jgi:hypothetical protein
MDVEVVGVSMLDVQEHKDFDQVSVSHKHTYIRTYI